jgi:signal transduction histidine kinase
MGAIAGLYATSRYNYLLFHGLVELFSVVVACGIFMIAWNSRHFVHDGFVMLLGVGYLCVGALDLLHTLGYPGMGVFAGFETNVPTQLWIAARYMEASTLCLAPLLIGRRLNAPRALGAYGIVLLGVLLSIFTWGVFPICFVEGQGLTAFKRISEYVISGLFMISIVALVSHRDRFNRKVMILTVLSAGVSILSELSFTLYVHAYGASNMVGHLFKLISFCLLYKAAIETSLTRPYSMLFQGLKRTEDQLRSSRDDLEQRVEQRTAELRQAVEQRDRELADRELAESRLQEERSRLFSLMQMLPGYVVLQARDYRIRFANDKFLELFGPLEERPCYALLLGRDSPCEPCPVQRVFGRDGPVEWEWHAPDGRVYHVVGYPFSDTDGTRLALELGIDITDREELQSQVLESGEAERRRIGQDLHDSLGQTLSGLSCLSKVVHRKLVSRGVEEADDLARIESLLAESVTLTRSLAHGLNPVGLTGEGLVNAMRELAENTEGLFGVHCSFECPSPIDIADGALATHLYRIAQEATHNAARHARAREIGFSLVVPNGEIVLSVQDDGAGIPEGTAETRGMGLRVMRYRAHRIGGALSIRAGERGGTVVTCRVPLRQGTEIEQ